MLFSGFSQAATFFGNEWFKKTDEGISVIADSVPLPLLLKEWCQVCEQDCIIDHDIKQKLSLNIEKSSCTGLLQAMTAGVAVDNIGLGKVFQKKSKGEWTRYACAHRKPSEVASQLKKLLVGSAKGDQVLSDNPSGTVWIPKEFYHKHKELVKSLDSPKQQYNMHIAWFRVSEKDFATMGLIEPLGKPFTKWCLGEPLVLSKETVLNWLEQLEKRGIISTVSEVSMVLMDEETSQQGISEIRQTTRMDKKGNTVVMDIPESTTIKAKPQRQANGEIELNISIQDGYLPQEGFNYKQSDILLEQPMVLRLGQSQMLSGLSRTEHLSTKRCFPLISRIPILGRIFCTSKTEKQTIHYAVVIMLN